MRGGKTTYIVEKAFELALNNPDERVMIVSSLGATGLEDRIKMLAQNYPQVQITKTYTIVYSPFTLVDDSEQIQTDKET